MAIRNMLFTLWTQKELELGRELKLREVAEATGLSIDTISRAKNGTTVIPDDDTINKLCKFFDCPAGPIPFLIFEPD